MALTATIREKVASGETDPKRIGKLALETVFLGSGSGGIREAMPRADVGVVTLSEIGPIWTINQQAKSLKSIASTLAVVGKFRSV